MTGCVLVHGGGGAVDAPAFEKALSGYYRERTEEEQRMRGSSAIMC